MRKFIVPVIALVVVVMLSMSGHATAQNASDIFSKYTNPHAVCDFYRSSEANISTANGQVIRPTVVRESDTECLISLGEGKQTVYTQFYYSGDSWCWQMYQNGKSVYHDCVPKPLASSDLTKISDKFNQYFTEENTPYIVTGFIILVIIISITTSRKPPVEPALTENSDQEQSPSGKPPEYRVPHSTRSKTYKPKPKKRILDDLINEKPGHKHKK